MLQFFQPKTARKLSNEALRLASKELNCLPKNLKSYCYEVGFKYADGGIDFRQIFVSPDDNVVEMNYSHGGPNKGWLPIELVE